MGMGWAGLGVGMGGFRVEMCRFRGGDGRV